MNILKKIFSDEIAQAEREELRQLRIKCDYQERWIHSSMKKDHSTHMQTLMRKIGALQKTHPEIWKEFFSKHSVIK